MRIQVKPGSAAEKLHYQARTRYNDERFERTALAPGVTASPDDDLLFRGGKTVPQLAFQNVYLGRSSDFAPGDVESIDAAITRAMRHRPLNNVLQQYFQGEALSCDVAASLILDEDRPAELDEPDIQDKIIDLFDAGLIHDGDLDRTVFNLVLPRGTTLRLGRSSSRDGLGGYHGSVHFIRGGVRRTLYYSANAYSEGDNGIVVFDAPWKNVVGTLYHELVEFMTDPDVSDAINTGELRFIGWNSRHGEEIGDQPLSANSGELTRVFKEVVIEPPPTPTPVQFMYSNHVHGPEGPIDEPHGE